MAPPIPGPLAWYDASDTANIIGSPAATWLDQSGNGRNLTQLTAGLRPATGTRTLNGLNCLDFDGVDDALSHSTFPIDASMTVFAAVVQDTQTGLGGTDAYVAIGPGGVGLIGQRSFDAPKGWFCYAGGGAIARTTAVTTGVTYAVCCKLNGASSVARKDGVAGSVTDIGTSTDTGLFVGNTAAADGPFDGALGELIIYDTVLTDAECTSTEQYLSAKWGSATPPGLLAIPQLRPQANPNVPRMSSPRRSGLRVPERVAA